MKPESKKKRSSRCLARLVRGLWCWMLANGRSIRALCWTLPQYVWGNLHPFRHQTEPTTPRLLLGERKWITVLRWELPRLDVKIMDGMGEHYDYPRHHAYVLLWWNRRGYAWGVEYSTNDERMHPYQRERTSITGFVLKLREIIETGRLVGVVMTRLVLRLVSISSPLRRTNRHT